jgi:3',5'-cyclic AMP phosphodiesterase CpdA
VRRVLVVLAAGALCLGAFALNARSQEPEPAVGLLATGDFGVGGTRQHALGTAMQRFEGANPADVLVTLGDNDYTERPAQFHRNWAESFGWLPASEVAVAGTLGNHDVRVARGAYQFRLLQMPGPFYRRAVGEVDLFVLDSNAPSARQTRWLASALASSTARWKIAVLHHPPFSCGHYRSHSLVVRRWVPLFERHRVRLVLAGHDHNYQRFQARRGVTYVVHGGGSGYFYRLGACPRGYPTRVRGRLEQGFLYLAVRDDRLDGYAVNLAGRRTDRFTLRP